MRPSIFTITILSFGLFIQACNNSSTNGHKNNVLALKCESKSFESGKEGDRCHIDVNYELAIDGPEKNRNIVNQMIEENIKNLLKTELDSTFTAPNLTDYFSKALEKCEKTNDDYYMLDLKANNKILQNGEGYITVFLQNSIFTGGAHPNYLTEMTVIDEKTGNILQLEDIFKNKEQLSQLCEKKFREDMKLSAQSDINEAGFWFENNKFSLSDNFGFHNDTLLVWYNPYEIASFAQGDIVLKIKPETWKKLKK